MLLARRQHAPPSSAFHFLLLTLTCVFTICECNNFHHVEWRFGPLVTLENLSTIKPKSIHHQEGGSAASTTASPTTTDAVPLKAEVCRQPAESGLCYAAITRVYFNFENKTCENFLWGGCNKNDNNFASKEECETFCNGVE